MPEFTNSNYDRILDATKDLRTQLQKLVKGTDLKVGTTGTAAMNLDQRESSSNADAVIALATVVLIVVLLLVIFRSPIIALLPIVLIAGPWYVRNLVLTGNPLFPMKLPLLPGLLRTTRALELQTTGGIFHVLVGGFFGIGLWLAGALVLGWILAWARPGCLRTPLGRLAMLGPVIGLGIFVFSSPYDEPRFADPSLAILFLSPAILATRWRWCALLLSIAFAAIALSTAFAPEGLLQLAPGIAIVALAATAAMAIARAVRHHPPARIGCASIAVLLLAAWIYVNWWSAERSYLAGDAPGDATTDRAWRDNYGDLGQAWSVLRQIAAAETIAYANTYFVYPLQGADGRNRVIHIPASPKVRTIADLPALADLRPLTGRQIIPAMVAAQSEDADEATWLSRLRDSGAHYLFVGKSDLNAQGLPPPQARWARRFTPVYENAAAAIYRIGETQPR
jgi:hypothetical protein